mmetsp:Transcript_4682/g.3938  ORF Transcript_4682/g.3938 Transcript_4682/m.3938 type:complete len:485 (+) Transcript_4682:49-1503(+)
MLVIYGNKRLKAYTSSTLSLVADIDLSPYIPNIKDLKSELVGIHPIISGPNKNHLILLTKNGDIYIIELSLINIKVVEKEEEVHNNTKERKRTQSLRVPKTLEAVDVLSFNTWDTVIESNNTLYEEEINEQRGKKLYPISLNYFGKGIDGNFIIADSQGNFNIFRKAIEDKKTRKEGAKPKFSLISRSHSGFDRFDILSSHNVFTIFSRGSSMGFLRTFDGQMVKSSCEVGTQQIISIAHDPSLHGRFYVGTENGDIIVFSLTQNKKKIGCSIEGKITGEPSNHFHLYPLNRFLVKVENNGEMFIYNITDTKVEGKQSVFGSIKSTKYKPVELEGQELSFLNPRAIVTSRSSSITFHVSQEGKLGELTVIEIVDPAISSESFLAQIVENKAVVVVVPILVVLFYHMFIKKSDYVRRETNSRKKDPFNTPSDDPTDRIDALSKRLESLGQTSELFDKMGKDPSNFDPGRSQRRKEKFGNKIDFLE